jgi:hypothetical protein
MTQHSLPSPRPEPDRATARAGLRPAVTTPRVLAGICLLLPLVALMWVPSYRRATPTLGGIPFFYWYQLLWVPISAVLTYTAYLLVRRDEAARRASGPEAGGERA